MPTALITGVSGQDGSYLAAFLLGKGYKVIGVVRHNGGNLDRIAAIRQRLEIVEADVTNEDAVENVIRCYRPREIYNLASRASGTQVWAEPVLTGDVNGLNVTRWLEAIRKVDVQIRFCQASSCEIFGNAVDSPQSEMTPLRPRNPYGAAKAYAQSMIANYRQAYGMFASSAILFNHESPRRGMEFVTRKISHGAASIKWGLARELRLGNLEAQRDWGFAGEYVQAMWSMLQQSQADDFVVATGELHSVRDFCELAFSHLGMDYREHVVQESQIRRGEQIFLVGNAGKAKQVLGWQPQVDFRELVAMMVDADVQLLRQAAEEPVSFEDVNAKTYAENAPRAIGDV